MEADALDDTANHHWDPEIDLKSEKQKLFTALSNFVPHSEIYFNHMAAGKLAERQRQGVANPNEAITPSGRPVKQIARFDPRKPQAHLVKEKEPPKTTEKEGKKDAGFLKVMKENNPIKPVVSMSAAKSGLVTQEKVVEISSNTWKDIMV